MADLDGRCHPPSLSLANVVDCVADLLRAHLSFAEALVCFGAANRWCGGWNNRRAMCIESRYSPEWLLCALGQACAWQVTRAEWDVGVGVLGCGDTGRGAEQMGLIVTGSVIPGRADWWQAIYNVLFTVWVCSLSMTSECSLATAFLTAFLRAVNWKWNCGWALGVQ